MPQKPPKEPFDKKSKEKEVAYKPKLVIDLRLPPTGNLPAVQGRPRDTGKVRDLPMALDDLMNFGRYNEVQIAELIQSYPRYIFWCIENVDWFWLDKEAYKTWRQRMGEVRDMEKHVQDCLQDELEMHSDFCDCP